MRTLRQKDLKALIALLDSFDHIDAGAFPGRVAVGLHTLVPGAVASYNEFGPRSTTVAAVEPDDARSTGDEEAFVRLAWQHPVLARFRAARSQPARAISDYATRQELERLELYHDVYRPLGIADQISIALPGPGALTIGVAMGRERWGFSQRERLLLELLRPHLAVGRARAARDLQRREARAALEAASTARQPRAVVVLTRDGRITWTTPSARRLLREWFGYSGGPALPPQLTGWIASTRATAGPAIPAPAAGTPRLVRGERTLAATLLAAPERDGGLLLTFEQHAIPRREQLTRLGLTRREGEVLAVAARGLDEQGIARALAISRRTVNKHLEHTYRKLNVSDRSQAIATAFDAADPTRHGERAEESAVNG